MSRAPGPKGHLIWGSLPDFKADPLGFLTDVVQDHGDIARLRFGHITAHLINHPDYIDRILSRNCAQYDKTTRSADRIAATTGDSLLSANQQAWERHRRLIQPSFQPNCFDKVEPVIDALLMPMMDKWRQAGTIDIVDQMMQLVIASVIKIMFSSDVDPQRINTLLETLLADTWRRIEAPLDASMISAHFHKPAFKAALDDIDKIVFELIQTRRMSGQEPNDVLSRLLDAHETAGEAQLSDKELRDSAVTLLLAGHETTANALSWAFIRASDGLETAPPADIFSEAIRLYPSIWVIERRAVRDDVIDGYKIPRGSSVLISPYLLHRHHDYWPDPERFDPSRFKEDRPRAAQAYLPYGLGPHRCVGLHLANKIASHIIQVVFDHVHLKLVPDQQLGTDPGITLRHSGPVMMCVEKRNI